MEAWRFDGEDEATVLAEKLNEPPNVYGFGHAAIIRDFKDAVTEDKEPVVNGCEGRKALELILAIYHSARLKKEIKLPAS